MKKIIILPILMIVAVLLVSGCTQQTSPTLKIKSPVANAEISGSSVTVELDIKNFDLVKPTDAKTGKEFGKGHVHAYLDNSNEQKGAETTFTWSDVAAGKHTIRVELHNHDHTSYSPEVKAEVTFNLLPEPIPFQSNTLGELLEGDRQPPANIPSLPSLPSV